MRAAASGSCRSMASMICVVLVRGDVELLARGRIAV